jgi:hypothetical protein
MRYRNLSAIFLSLSLLSPSPAAAQAPDARPDLGANAAMKYWQAFALLPTLDKDQEKLLQEWSKVPLDAAALKLIEGSRMSLVYLHRGAKLRRCDWSLDYEDGIGLPLTYCPRARTLSRLAALHARREFEQGHGRAGWDDVIALLKLGRDVEMCPQLVGTIAGYAIETTAIEAAVPYLPELKSILPESALAALDALPVAPTLQQMVLDEKQTGLVWLIRKLEEAERHKEGSWRDIWRQYVDLPDEGGQGTNRDLLQSVRTFEQATKMLEALLPFYDQLAMMMALPWKEFDARFPEFVKKANAASPLAGVLGLPIMDQVVARERRNQTQMALFKAAIAVVRGGPDGLKDINDPFGDGPFEYRALDKGFALKSKLFFKGQPVMLTVGKEKKE